jgi:hypothetical protein
MVDATSGINLYPGKDFALSLCLVIADLLTSVLCVLLFCCIRFAVVQQFCGRVCTEPGSVRGSNGQNGSQGDMPIGTALETLTCARCCVVG